MKIINIVGTRPNVMKIAPLMRGYRAHDNIDAMLAHAKQRHDQAKSERLEVLDELDQRGNGALTQHQPSASSSSLLAVSASSVWLREFFACHHF